jgi:hypothetical protein
MSIYISVLHSEDSSIRFGGYDLSLSEYGTESSIAWFDTVTTDTWDLNLKQIYFNENQYLNNDLKAHINPASPFISISEDLWYEFAYEMVDLDDEIWCYWPFCATSDSCNKH